MVGAGGKVVKAGSGGVELRGGRQPVAVDVTSKVANAIYTHVHARRNAHIVFCTRLLHLRRLWRECCEVSPKLCWRALVERSCYGYQFSCSELFFHNFKSFQPLSLVLV
ncbi:hypothetical protein MTO96_008749 [Rhipicephalus appendiculatus]